MDPNKVKYHNFVLGGHLVSFLTPERGHGGHKGVIWGPLGWFKYGKNDKLDILLLLWPDSESFGKWCLEKCKNFFDTTTLMPAKSVPKFYYITHLCELEQNRKLIFFSFFKNEIIIIQFLFSFYSGTKISIELSFSLIFSYKYLFV